MEHAEADCRTVLERLFLYLDGEIAEGDCAAIERHLAACRDCLGHADFERGVKDFVRRACCEDLPPGLVERVRARFRELL